MSDQSKTTGQAAGRSKVASHVSALRRSGIRDFFDIVSTQKDIISLGIGEPDFVTPWRIRESAIFALDHGATAYTSNLGLLELRTAISRYLKDDSGLCYDPETEILITVGVSEALDLALRAMLEPGDEVLYHEPCYVSYAPIIALTHAVPVPVSTRREDEFRLTRALLEEKVTERTKVLILNFPTNPTGAVLTRKDAEEIADFAIEHDLIVITDEIYSELTFEEERVSVASMPDMKSRTIFLHGLSKGWAMTGFRIGFSCAPQELTEAMMKIHQYSMLCAPILSQKAAIEALTNGASDVVAMRDEYEARRNVLDNAFREMGVPCTRPKGSFYAFPYIGEFGIPSKDFSLRLLDEKRVACVPGSAFGPAGEGFIRCAFATAMDELQEALSRIADFVQSLRG